MSLVGSLLTSEDELHALRRSWSSLARSSPFQSPEWLLPWWRQFGTGRPLVATVRADERLVGVLACYVLDAAHAKLLPIGAGISDYLDALVAPDAPPETGTMLLATVLGGAPGAASCDLIDLPPGAVLLEAAAPPGWHDQVAPTATCPVLTLSEPRVSLRQAIPSNTHRKLRMNRHRAERNGGWTHHVAGRDDLLHALEMLERLHGLRWHGRGAPGVFNDSRVGACLRDAARPMLDSDALRLHTLRFGSDIVAACLTLAAGPERLMLYLSGFDPAHAACSPGTILLGEILETAITDGRREIHFLRGGESYKYAWGAEDRFNTVRRLAPP